MASEDAKRVKKEENEDENDEKSLSSLLQNKNKKPNGSTKSLSLKDAKLKKLGSKLKKEEESDDDFTPIKKTPNNVKPKKEGSGSAEAKKTPISKLKKEEVRNDNTKTPKTEVKKEKSGLSDKKKEGKLSEQNGKKQKEENKKGGKGEDSSVKREKREKKVYDLPGQKRDPPEERDPLRIFYESLYKQIPTSEMAAIWMMESGLLPKDVAKKLFEAKGKKSQQQKLSSPMKTVVNVKKHTDSSSVSVKKKTVSTEKKKTPTPIAPSAQSKKRKSLDESSEDSDDDFVISKKIKKPRAA